MANGNILYLLNYFIPQMIILSHCVFPLGKYNLIDTNAFSQYYRTESYMKFMRKLEG